MTHEDARREQILQENDRLGKNKFGSKLADIYFATMIIVGIAASSVLCLGTIFYRRSKKAIPTDDLFLVISIIFRDPRAVSMYYHAIHKQILEKIQKSRPMIRLSTKNN